MNILFLDQHFASNQGFVNPRSLYLASFLVKRGHKVTVICGLNRKSGFRDLNRYTLINRVVIEGVYHPKCISGKCNGVSQAQAEKQVQRVAKAEWKYQMGQSSEYRKTCERFPGLLGSKVTVFDPLEQQADD